MKMPSAKPIFQGLFSLAASVAGTFMVVRSVARDLLPREIQDSLFSGIRNLFSRFSSELTIVIEEFDGLVNNHIYEAAEVYFGPKISPSARRLRVCKPEKEMNFTITMEMNEEMVDDFDGVRFQWIWVCVPGQSKYLSKRRDPLRSEVRSFELSFHKKHKEKVFSAYLPHIVKVSNSMKEKKKTVKLFTTDSNGIYEGKKQIWSSINLDHPATFETLAMDPELKRTIMEDLDRFVKRKEFYRKVGKAWKRGYLLYGPPGTGKSSLIAAMANYLKFDIYDLELTDLRRNSDLRRLLVATANQSILVVEDIDCTIKLQEQMAKAVKAAKAEKAQAAQRVTLSGLLNFIDGLWSSCGDERIIVFTTNKKERLDPALLRPGRMDVHIHMSHCTPSGFKLLASNYLGINEHPLFGEVDQLLGTSEVTPAEVAEELLKQEDADAALEGLIHFIQQKKKDGIESNWKATDFLNTHSSYEWSCARPLRDTRPHSISPLSNGNGRSKNHPLVFEKAKASVPRHSSRVRASFEQDSETPVISKIPPPISLPSFSSPLVGFPRRSSLVRKRF